MKTLEAENNTIMAFIKYKTKESVRKAVNYDEIICCGIPLRVREAYTNRHNKNKNKSNCSCIICDHDLQLGYKKVLYSIFDAIKQFHSSGLKQNDKKQNKIIKKELKASSKKLYKQLKSAIKQ